MAPRAKKTKVKKNACAAAQITELGRAVGDSRVKFPRLRLTITKKQGYCYHLYDVDDKFILEDFTHPPKNLCLGIVHSLFPAMYALSFGAEFPFMENMLSLRTTCPDGKKVEFLTELVDEKGRVIVKRRPQGPPQGPNPKAMEIEVNERTGPCFYDYQKGQKFSVCGLKTPPEGFCGAAYHMMFPVLFALNFGAKFPFQKDPNSLSTPTCPDGGHVTFTVRRIEGETKEFADCGRD